MTWDNEREKRMEELWEQLDELDEELDATGLDDALDWERFPELERVLDALAWNRAERWADRSERWAELAEVAEESALSELAAFGSCQGWFFGSAECSVVYETGFELYEDDRIEMFDGDGVSQEWRAWEAASEDIPGFFALNLSI